MENLIKMDGLGVPLFLETPMFFVDPFETFNPKNPSMFHGELTKPPLLEGRWVF